MDLNTRFMGLELDNPFVPSATPLSKDLDSARQLEDAGAGALIMHSLFQEQIEENSPDNHSTRGGGDLFDHTHNLASREEYLEQFKRLRDSLGIPVIPSLNASSPGDWARYAKQLESAGAPALELNIFFVGADITETAVSVEERTLNVFRAVKENSRVPVCFKLSPHFSSFGNMVKTLEQEGASGVSLFNSFYQPIIDLETLTLSNTLDLTGTANALLAIRWAGILYGRTKLSIAISGGVHFAEDALKMLACGADITCLGSALLMNGPKHLSRVRENTINWLEQRGYDSLSEFRGILCQANAKDPSAFARSHYMKQITEFNI